jgi:hypothetical protein
VLKLLPSKEEFESYVERIPFAGCWIWSRSRGQQGYGDFKRGGKNYQAHRYSYQLYRGEVGWHHVLHKCDVPGCVNPEHLFLGSNQDNIADSVAKGRRKGRPRTRPSGLIYKRPDRKCYEGRRKISLTQREEVKSLRSSGVSAREIAARFGVSVPLIYMIVNGTS